LPRNEQPQDGREVGYRAEQLSERQAFRPVPFLVVIRGWAASVMGSRRGPREEGFQVLAGDDPPAADLEVGELAGAHLVIQQVAGQPGDRRRLVHRIGQAPSQSLGGMSGIWSSVLQPSLDW